MKKELCKKVVEIQRKNGSVMKVVLDFDEECIRVQCAYAVMALGFEGLGKGSKGGAWKNTC